MAYTFFGILAKGVEIATDLDLGVPYTVRKISAPFEGSGVIIEKSNNPTPSKHNILELAAKLGLRKDDHWIFLSYKCWGGSLESIFTFLNLSGEHFGPTGEEEPKAEFLYLNVMKKFGVSQEDALDFPPFRRGFWGEQ